MSDALLPACQNAAVFQYLHHNYTNYEPSEDFNVLSTEIVTTTEGTILPLSLPEIAGNCHDHNELLEKLKYTDADREKILQETNGQSENAEWFNQRKGRITCSRMHSVFTKSETLKKNKAVNTESLVTEILGYKEKNSNIPALKYGRFMEPVARRKYKCILLQRKHQDLKVVETGLYIDTKRSYLGSSPDGIIECSCCGSGVLEIKCPLSIAHTIPSHENLTYLVKEGSNITLQRNHNYYTQIQGQMAICNKQWCDFFIFTKHGHHLERILFQKDYWEKIVSNLENFFLKYVVVELLTQDIKKKVAHTETSSGTKSNTCTDSIPLLAINTCKPTKPTQAKGKKLNKRRKKVEPKPIYLCGSCQQTCLEIDELDNNCESDYSIGCDKCRKWFHWGCIGFDGMLNMDKWYCDDCEASKENSL